MRYALMLLLAVLLSGCGMNAGMRAISSMNATTTARMATPSPTNVIATATASPTKSPTTPTTESIEERALSLRSKEKELENLAPPKDMADYYLIIGSRENAAKQNPGFSASQVSALVERQAPPSMTAAYKRVSKLRDDWLANPANADYATYWKRKSEEAAKGNDTYNIEAYLKETGRAGSTFR